MGRKLKECADKFGSKKKKVHETKRMTKMGGKNYPKTWIVFLKKIISCFGSQYCVKTREKWQRGFQVQMEGCQENKDTIGWEFWRLLNENNEGAALIDYIQYIEGVKDDRQKDTDESEPWWKVHVRKSLGIDGITPELPKKGRTGWSGWPVI